MLALPDGHWIPGKGWMQEGPAFRRLTAAADSLHDPNRLHAWLEAFLPENGARTPYRAHAALELDRHGYTGARDNPAALLWGNVNVEYAGAVTFMQAPHDPPEALPAAAEPAYHSLTDTDIADRLREATLIARNTLPGRPRAWPERRASLSGMRGKLCLTPSADGHWTAAHGSSLNTWVVKDEHDPDLPGEAGIESICQRTLALLGVPAATACARVFAGRQAVLSERTDRRVEPDGIVCARHQEEWCQILGFDPSRKYDDGTRDEPRWPSAYQVLMAHAADPAHEHARLTRAVAATWLLAHCDLHRRNLGFLHAPADARPPRSNWRRSTTSPTRWAPATATASRSRSPASHNFIRLRRNTGFATAPSVASTRTPRSALYDNSSATCPMPSRPRASTPAPTTRMSSKLTLTGGAKPPSSTSAAADRPFSSSMRL